MITKFKIFEQEVSSGNATGKGGGASLPLQGYYKYGNTGEPGITFTPTGKKGITNYKNSKHSKKELKKREKMKHLKKFEEIDYHSHINRNINEDELSEDIKFINIALDVSGSINNDMVRNALLNIDIPDYDKINFIQFDYNVKKVDIIDDVEDIFNIKWIGGFGTNIQPVIDYIVNNDLNHNKTYIISDFYADNPDYSKLSDYELINLLDYENDPEKYNI